MFRLIRELIRRPNDWQLVVILLAMLVETTMSLAGPWPLRITIDNVVGDHKMTPWLDHLIRPMLEGSVFFGGVQGFCLRAARVLFPHC